MRSQNTFSLGAQHDNPDWNGCSSQQQYVMASYPLQLTNDTLQNPFRFSRCSVEYFRRYVTALNKLVLSLCICLPLFLSVPVSIHLCIAIELQRNYTLLPVIHTCLRYNTPRFVTLREAALYYSSCYGSLCYALRYAFDTNK